MKITFLGAAHEVTGSCTYIEVGDKKGVVDYGMEQGKNLFENAELPVSPAELDFALGRTGHEGDAPSHRNNQEDTEHRSHHRRTLLGRQRRTQYRLSVSRGGGGRSYRVG